MATKSKKKLDLAPKRLGSDKLLKALNAQVGNEMHASMQYIAIAAHFDAENLPRLAAFFGTRPGRTVLGRVVGERRSSMVVTWSVEDGAGLLRSPQSVPRGLTIRLPHGIATPRRPLF